MTANAIIETQPAQIAPPAQPSESGAILSMIERAARDPSVDIEKFERLMAMRERMDARAAQTAFSAAVSDAKAEIQPVIRNAKGHNDKKYADFAAIAREVDPILSRFGLSYRFRSAQADRITVTCILSHRGGHSEETTLSGPADTSGSKNAIQAIGSTLAYLMRYSLTLSLGLASANDDDGRAAGAGATIEAEQVVALQRLIAEYGVDKSRFLSFCKVESLMDIQARDYPRILATLKQKAPK